MGISRSRLVSSPATGKSPSVYLHLTGVSWQSQDSVYHLASLPYKHTAVYTCLQGVCDPRLSQKHNGALEREIVYTTFMEGRTHLQGIAPAGDWSPVTLSAHPAPKTRSDPMCPEPEQEYHVSIALTQWDKRYFKGRLFV